MFVIPILAAVGLAGAGTVCWRGTVTASGTGPAGEWRIRWACWRWLVERKLTGTAWARYAVFPMGERERAQTAAVLSVTPQLLSGIAPGLLRVIKRMQVAQIEED